MISIVEDDAAVREATKLLIRSLGYTAATFASAEEFLHSNHVDGTSCLITDIQLPGITGVELQEKLVAEGHRIPIIFITAFPHEHMRTRVLKAGAIAFLRKPFTDDSLIGYLDKALEDFRSGTAER